MLKKTNSQLRRALAAMLCIAGAFFAGQSQALLVNFDLTSSTGGDAYNTGPAVFGTATSQWNERSRLLSASNVALFDDTGAASPVTVSYTRSQSGSMNAGFLTGAFQNLGISEILTGTVTLGGLVAGDTYQLAIFSAWDESPSWTVGSQTGSTVQTSDWSSLNQGTQYALFQAVADGAGTVSFTPNPNPSAPVIPGSLWSALQLQSVPEPGTLALFGTGLAGLLARRRKAA